MKKVYLSSLVLFMFLFLLVGCTSNTPTSKTEEYLNRYVSMDDEVKKSMETTISGEGLSTSNQELYKEVLTRQYKDMKYEVKDETIDGDEAVVTVKITVYDLYKSDLTSLDYLNNNSSEFYVDNVLDQDLYDKYRIKSMLDTKDTVDYEIDFFLTKENGTWIVQNPDSITLEKLHGLYNYEEQTFGLLNVYFL